MSATRNSSDAYPLARIPVALLFAALLLLLGTAGGIELVDHSAEFAQADQLEAQQVAADAAQAAASQALAAHPNGVRVRKAVR